MNDEEIIAAFGALYEDVAERDQFYVRKPLLAHYTSLNTLERILQTDEVWFSNPLFMNDHEEVRFGMLRGLDLVFRNQDILEACGSASRAELFTRHIERYFSDFESQHAFDTYVFCLSEHDPDDWDGMLSMWRGYGSYGGGAAIVVDAAQLPVAQHSPLIIARVQYLSTEGRLEWLNGAISKCARILREIAIPDDKIYLAAHMLFGRIRTFALFSKHSGFAEEREWRVVYVRDLDRDKKFDSMFHYRIGPQGVEPKLRLKVEPIEGIASDLSLGNIVERIILGPSISSALAKTAVLRMLDRLDKAYLKEKVFASTIPFRSK